MKRSILKIIILSFVGISMSSCYQQVSDKINYYLSQNRDPDLLGFWMEDYYNGAARCIEYRDDGKVYYHTKYADGTVTRMTKSIEYWYTKDNILYYMDTRGESMKPYESSWTYTFSDNNTILHLSHSMGSGGTWTRTTLPE